MYASIVIVLISTENKCFQNETLEFVSSCGFSLESYYSTFVKKLLGQRILRYSRYFVISFTVMLIWFPLYVRRFGHRCLIVQNAIKGDIPERFEIFRNPLSHNCNTRNCYLFRLPKPRTQWGRQTTYFRVFNDWATLPTAFKRPMPDMIFKRNLKRF